MKMIEAINAISEISAFQKGLFTTAQAKELGVERYVLSRLEKSGIIERLAKGVYRVCGAPSPRETDVFAAWLSLNPTRKPGAYDAEADAVAMGATAAWLLQIGEIGPSPLEFCTSRRRQTQRQGLIIHKRALEKADVVIVAGIPTTAAARTVVDLIDASEDLSLVASCLRDALEAGLVPDEQGLAKQIDSRAGRAGYPVGTALCEMMRGGLI